MFHFIPADGQYKDQMIALKNRFTYFLHFSVIISSYLMGIGVTPPSAAWVINKLFYLSLGTLFLKQLVKINSIVKNAWFPLFSLMLYVTCYLLSTLVIQPESYSLGQIISNSFFYIIIFIVFCGIIFDLDFKELLFPFFIGTLVVLLLSLPPLFGYEYTYYGTDEARLAARIAAIKSSLQDTGFARYSGVYTNQNGFGLVLALGLGISLALYCDYILRSYRYNRLQVILIKIVFVSSFLFALITLSRASLLAIFIILSIFIYKTINNRKTITAIIILSIFSILFLYLNKEILELVFYRFTAQGTSSRDLIWNDAFQSIANYPIAGVGEFVHIRNNREYTAHNVYLQIMANNGIFAGFFWILWAGFYLCSSVRIIFSRWAKKDLRALVLAALCIAILIHQLFEVHVNRAIHVSTFCLMLSMTLSYHLFKNKTVLSNSRDLNRIAA